MPPARILLGTLSMAELLSAIVICTSIPTSRQICQQLTVPIITEVLCRSERTGTFFITGIPIIRFSLSSDCIRRFCEKYREARIILISSWKNGFISSHNEKNTPQIKELEAQLDRYGIRIVGKVCDNRYRDYAVRDYLKEHPSIREYVVADDDIKEYSSKDIPHLRLVDSKVGFR